jgi:Uma2 family endonuclease
MPATLQPPLRDHEPRNMLHGISWETYAQMLEDIGEQPGLRLTYDEGSLEIMTTSALHEYLKSWMAQVIEMMCFQLGIRKRCGGSFTHKREDLLKGIEPDECYWIQNEPAVRGRKEIDLSVDPPPDLAVEVDISRSWLDRIAIFAALRIPEVWCFDGRLLRIHLLQSNGEYGESSTGAAFPFLPMAEFARFLQFEEGTDELTQMQAFVNWLREQDFRIANRD